METDATMRGEASSDNAAQSTIATTVIDATVLTVCSYDKLRRLVDWKKVRAMLEREVDRAGEGAVHLTPLFIYLFALAKPWYATGDVMACVRELGSALEQRGVRVRLPDAYRYPAKPREARGASARTPEIRTPMGTRAGERRRRTPQPRRDGF